MDYNKYTKEELVTLCNTYKNKIDYLESLKNHVVLDNVSHQRELLSDCVHFVVDLDQSKFDTYDKQVDEFIKSLNCG